MELNQVIATQKDRQKWKEFLAKRSKEELIELLVDRMTRDINFSREVHCRLSQPKMKVDETISEYEQIVKNEMEQKVPDVNFLEIVSNKIIETADNTKNLSEQLRLYVSVILSIDNGRGEAGGKGYSV